MSEPTVQVWVARLDLGAEAHATMAASLGRSEQDRAGRYLSARDGHRYTAARGWLRHVLGAATGCDAAEVAITAGPGKPRLMEGGLSFSLSRAGGLALIAVSGREVGVDLEPVEAGQRALEVAGLACSPRETALLAGLPPGQRAKAALWLWTAKEAYLKAIGTGLAVPPDLVEVGEDEKGLGAPVGLAGEGGPGRWRAREVRPAKGFVAAVAAEGTYWRVHLRRAEEILLAAPQSMPRQ